MPELYDVAVVGRGLIGSAAARHLAESGIKVVVIGDEPADRRLSLGPFCSHPDEGRITRVAGRTPSGRKWLLAQFRGMQIFPRDQGSTSIMLVG